MKTFIIFDTNILFQRSYDDFSKFRLHQTFDDLRGKIERYEVESQFEILVPEITINELFQQQLESFEETIQNLKSNYRGCQQIYEIDLKIDENFNYRNFLESVKNQYIESEKINILPICSEHRFHHIVSRALNKHAPFEGGTKGNSDKGFKDAVIWESILEFAINNSGEFIFLTNDKRFKDRLTLEFEEVTGRKIRIFNNDELSSVHEYIQKHSTEQVNRIKFNKMLQNLEDEFPKFFTFLRGKSV